MSRHDFNPRNACRRSADAKKASQTPRRRGSDPGADGVQTGTDALHTAPPIPPKRLLVGFGAWEPRPQQTLSSDDECRDERNPSSPVGKDASPSARRPKLIRPDFDGCSPSRTIKHAQAKLLIATREVDGVHLVLPFEERGGTQWVKPRCRPIQTTCR
jgi:hypothetical protein